ncbi:calcium/calmodulin dependent protein kinase [Massarina eburnea CBS 473.64]|uniref:Cyclin-dependent kinase 1 n=1 Tax=Massarina eburnea CBS 473.64 TaxID=1395130 RepID=A0A6A6S4L1_9PLEO|nr:calcium/calmodulin dependent protein kinase [Massarina eburnea CBS 473.64]
MFTYFISRANNEKFILKYVHEDNLEDLQDLKGRLRGTNYVRLVKDTIPEESMFVFQYFTDHLLRLAQKDLPLALTKRILKDALRGIVELHDRDIVHTADIKADNILINWNEDQDGIGIERVQIADLEDAVYVPPGQNIVGLQAGNWMWRSPEAHVRGPINKPSDIFSFALVCIHAVHKRVIFAVGEEELVGNLNREATVVARQMSYFADREGLCAFLDHIGDNPWVPLLEAARDGAFKKDKPRRLFSLLGSVDEDFENLVYAMANFDPAKRITAREALAHKWFDGV